MKLGKRSNVPGSNAGRRLLRLLAGVAIIASSAAGGEVRVPSSILSPLRVSEAPAAEAGVLHRLGVSEGDEVTRGQTIGVVDARRQKLEVNVARQDLALARREAESDVRIRLAGKVQRVAQAELARSTSVNADFPNTVSAKEIERLRLSVEQAGLEIEHARFEQTMLALKIGRIEATLRLAEHNVERMRVVAPVAGVVAEVHKRAGEWVDQGEPVLRIVRVDRLKLEGYVPVEEAITGLVGRPVRVTVPMRDGPPVEATGRVTFVSPEAEPVNAQVLFQAEIDNTRRRLRPGLTASMVIIGTADAKAQTSDPVAQLDQEN